MFVPIIRLIHKYHYYDFVSMFIGIRLIFYVAQSYIIFGKEKYYFDKAHGYIIFGKHSTS